MSLESSFFDGASFIEEGGGKPLENVSTRNLEELLQADDVDPDAFLIKHNSGQAPNEGSRMQRHLSTSTSNVAKEDHRRAREQIRAQNSLSPMQRIGCGENGQAGLPSLHAAKRPHRFALSSHRLSTSLLAKNLSKMGLNSPAGP